MALTSASARCSILFAAVVVRSLSKPLKDVNDVNVFCLRLAPCSAKAERADMRVKPEIFLFDSRRRPLGGHPSRWFLDRR